MSQENVEVVRRLYSLLTDRGAWRRREYDDVFLEYCSADYELIPPPAYPDAATSYRGLEGVHQWERLIDEIWIDWDFEAERFFDAGDGGGLRSNIRDRQAKWGGGRDFRSSRGDSAGRPGHADRGVP